MDVGGENPFLDWLGTESYLNNQTDVIYLPSNEVVSTILKKSGLTVSNFKNTVYLERYDTIKRAFLRLWKKKGDSDFDSKKFTVRFDDKTYKVVAATRFYGYMIRFINGWIGTPALGIYLTRVLKKDSGNQDNPFNIFIGQNRFLNYLPDITYLPKLYKELGVKDFDDMKIIGTGDWRKIWKENVSFVSDWDTQIEFRSDSGEPLYINILWKDGDQRFVYLEELPNSVLERLKLLIVQNRQMIPPTEWTKDPLQAVAKGNLRGKDLISLCNTSREVNAKCNANDQQLFKARLMEEFGLDWNKNHHDFVTPRELYMQMYIYFEQALEVKISTGTSYTIKHIQKAAYWRIPNAKDKSVILVPNETMRKFTNVMVIFPQAEHLSFYISANVIYDHFHQRKKDIQNVRAVDAQGIKTVLSEEDLQTFMRSMMRIATDRYGVGVIIYNTPSFFMPEDHAILAKILPNEKDRKVIIASSRYH